MDPRTRAMALVMAAVFAAGGGYALATDAERSEPRRITWQQLHRPLHLPAVSPGDPCPTSPVDDRVDWESARIFGGSGTGPGPAYPGLGGANGIVYVDAARDGWWGGKVFWYVKPEYRGRVLIRGRGLKGPGRVMFSERGARRENEMRIGPRDSIPNGQSDRSRGVPSGTFVKAPPGCYGYQIDGLGFSRTIVFRAVAN